MKNNKKGFTLIELLVVIAIIGLLSTLAVVALNSARQRSRDAKRVADIRQVQTALELGFSEVGYYPAGTATITLGAATANKLCATSATGQGFVASTGSACTGTVYMGLVPTNPTPATTANPNYVYAADATGTGYALTFGLEGATGQLAAGPQCAKSSGITSTGTCTAP